MNLRHLGIGLFLCSSLMAGQEPPPGFEDPSLYTNVMGGKIVFVDKLDTKVAFQTVGKAFFPHTSPEAYAALAVNHPKYSSMFENVKEGKTIKVSDNKLEYDYALKLLVQVGFITQEATPEGHQILIPGADAISEYRIQNVITNYQDEIKKATQVTRIIPHDNGVLVEDDVYVEMHKAGAQTNIMKKKLKEFFSKYIVAFRKELTGTF